MICRCEILTVRNYLYILKIDLTEENKDATLKNIRIVIRGKYALNFYLYINLGKVCQYQTLFVFTPSGFQTSNR